MNGICIGSLRLSSVPHGGLGGPGLRLAAYMWTSCICSLYLSSGPLGAWGVLGVSWPPICGPFVFVRCICHLDLWGPGGSWVSAGRLYVDHLYVFVAFVIWVSGGLGGPWCQLAAYM
jgi:hypothetical protein